MMCQGVAGSLEIVTVNFEMPRKRAETMNYSFAVFAVDDRGCPLRRYGTLVELEPKAACQSRRSVKFAGSSIINCYEIGQIREDGIFP
jgi:hypothetical protein